MSARTFRCKRVHWGKNFLGFAPLWIKLKGFITVCKATKWMKNLYLIFFSIKVSGKILYSFQCGVSLKPNKNYCKESTSCCGNRNFVFQKVPYGQQKGNLCKKCLSLLLFISKKCARNDSKILPQLIHCCRMLQLTSYKLDGALT